MKPDDELFNWDDVDVYIAILMLSFFSSVILKKLYQLADALWNKHISSSSFRLICLIISILLFIGYEYYSKHDKLVQRAPYLKTIEMTVQHAFGYIPYGGAGLIAIISKANPKKMIPIIVAIVAGMVGSNTLVSY
jgi:hypothetical protein